MMKRHFYRSNGKSAKKFAQSNVQIWFLDEDLQKSAEYLTNIALNKTIDGCFCALCDALLYFSGIRNKKFHKYYFDKDRKVETVERLFPGWPLRCSPQMKYYESQASKWVRACGEHFDLTAGYMDILLTEYEYRFGKAHGLTVFTDWLKNGCITKIPRANIKNVVFPWKNLKREFRNKDIVKGYRDQFIDVFVWGDPMKAYMNCPRDMPDFIMKHFNMETAGMIT